MDEEVAHIRVHCRDCSFENVVASGNDEKPAEILIDHGQRTDHTLAIDRMSE